MHGVAVDDYISTEDNMLSNIPANTVDSVHTKARFSFEQRVPAENNKRILCIRDSICNVAAIIIDLVVSLTF